RTRWVKSPRYVYLPVVSLVNALAEMVVTRPVNNAYRAWALEISVADAPGKGQVVVPTAHVLSHIFNVLRFAGSFELKPKVIPGTTRSRLNPQALCCARSTPKFNEWFPLTHDRLSRSTLDGALFRELPLPDAGLLVLFPPGAKTVNDVLNPPKGANAPGFVSGKKSTVPAAPI